MDDFINSPAAFGALAMIGIGALLFAWGTIKRMILGDLPADLKALQKEVRDKETAQAKAAADAFKELTDTIRAGQEESRKAHATLREDMHKGFDDAKMSESAKRSEIYKEIKDLRDRVTKLEGKEKA